VLTHSKRDIVPVTAKASNFAGNKKAGNQLQMVGQMTVRLAGLVMDRF
jgi:hypothetical protein